MVVWMLEEREGRIYLISRYTLETGRGDGHDVALWARMIPSQGPQVNEAN